MIKLPKELKIKPSAHQSHVDYAEGWNDCLAEVQRLNATAQPKCQKCGDTGMADSGGTQPWGEPILIDCDCDTAQPVSDGWVKCSDRMPPVKAAIIVGKWNGRLWATKWATYIPSHPEANSFGYIMPGGSWEPDFWMPLPAAPGGQDA